MRTLRDSFEENYMAYEEACKTKKGFRIRYKYVGPWYRYQFSAEERHRYKRILTGLCLISTICFFAAAMRKCELNQYSFPVLFSGLSIAAFLFQWFGVVRFLLAGEKMTADNFKEINVILNIVPYINTIFLFAASLSCISMMVRNGRFSGMMTVPLCYLMAGICSGLISFFYKVLPYEKIKNHALEDDSKNFIRM